MDRATRPGATPADAQNSAARILLLTDGANSWGSDPMSAAQRAADLRVPVYSVLLGDDPGRADQLSPQETLTALAKNDDPSSHVIAGDALSPGTTDEVAGMIVEWVKSQGF